MAASHDFLKATLRSTCEVDDFTARLMDVYDKAYADRPAQYSQEDTFGIIRNDFMLHCPEGTATADADINNVEFNTIAASLGMLSTRTSEMHRYFATKLTHLLTEAEADARLPVNRAGPGIVEGFKVRAHCNGACARALGRSHACVDTPAPSLSHPPHPRPPLTPTRARCPRQGTARPSASLP